MKIRVKRFDRSLPLPVYKTPKAASLDLYTRETVTIEPGEVKLIPMNVAIELPEGYFALLVNRSSTFKMGITCVNGLGVIDYDYRGNDDEWLFPALNFTKALVTIEKGTRCCQMIILPIEQVEVEDALKLSHNNRGGFGSTGKK